MARKLIEAVERWKQTLQGVLVDWGEEPEDKQLDSFLRSLGTPLYPHAHGRTLYDHLTGTRNILRSWSQPFWVQAAGLFHSIYSSDIYRQRVLDASQRERLKALIGAKAERLVYLFSRVPRQRFFDLLFKTPSVPAQGLVVASGTPGELSEVVLDPSEVFGMTVVHMANEAEQSCLSDGRPGLWLARVSALGLECRKAEGEPPPVFDGCSVAFSPEDELRLRDAYNAAFERIPSDLPGAEGRFAECAEICAWVAEPLLLRGYLRALCGDAAGARELGLRAGDVLGRWGTPWDKRLSWVEWKSLAGALAEESGPERAGKLAPEFVAEPRRLLHRMTSRPRPHVHAAPAVPPAPQPAPTGVELGGSRASTRLEQYIASFADRRADLRKAVYPDLPSQPWLDPSGFPIVAALEAEYEQIKEEVMRLGGGDFHPESEGIARDGLWEVSFFYERGRKNLENCARCPTITSIVEQHETVRTQAGLIYVSRMRPGTYITPHRGPTNVRVRCHLAIQVPEGDCGLRVGGETGTWAEGRCIVFDDYYEHEAWNFTARDRIVLIVDLWHPGLTTHEREVLKGLHHYALAHAEGLNRYWARNEEAKAAYEYH